jgi:hypothetical protein
LYILTFFLGCWAFEPDDRPTISQVALSIETSKDSLSESLLDQIMNDDVEVDKMVDDEDNETVVDDDHDHVDNDDHVDDDHIV